MKELGKRLREKREALGIDLEQLQTMTKIRKRYLKALEDGDWSVLPGDVYARGFVRSYAESVGLDGNELLEKYVESRSGMMPTEQPPVEESVPGATSDQPERSRVDPPKRETATPIAPTLKPRLNRSTVQRQQRARKGANTAGQVAAVAAVLVVLAGAWWFLGKHPDKSSGNLQNSSTFGGTTNESTVGNSLQGNTSAPAATGNNTNNTTAAPTSPPPVQVVAQPFQNNTQIYKVTTTQPIAVVLSAPNDDCWVKVTSDGSVVDASDTVTKGQTRTWQASQSMTIRVGNVPAVTMTINGQAITLPNPGTAIDVQVVKAQT